MQQSQDVAAHYFDGRSTRARRVMLRVDRATLVLLPEQGEPVAAVSLKDVRWPERMRYGARIAQLPGGASLQALDVAAWDAWMRADVRQESLVTQAQQSWRSVLAALVLLAGLLAGVYVWGVPLAARAVVVLVPASLDAVLGEQSLRSIDGRLLEPSRLSTQEQARIRETFARAVRKTHEGAGPAWRLEFRRGKAGEDGKSLIGPNAFALPGGTIVLTDELVELVRDDQVVIGVLGHELGHVLHRHGMRQLVAVSALGAMASIAFGDYGTLITTAPVLIATMGYSRDAEREADAESIRLMKASGISPMVMVKFFEGVRGERARAGQGSDTGGIGIAFSSHPADAERIERFTRAAGR